MLDANLRRTEHVPCRMQRQRDVTQPQSRAIRERVERDVAEPGSQHAGRRLRREVARTAEARMIAMRVRDDGAVDGPPRIDEEIAGRTVQSLGTNSDQVHCVVISGCSAASP